MPPRYAYWTILIDQKPTAFRARDKEELLPTLHQLRRKNADVVMKWFARGRLWDTPEQALWAQKNMDRPREPRGRDWRPGGEHKDPRDRFKRRPERRTPDTRAAAGGDKRAVPNPRPPDLSKAVAANRGDRRRAPAAATRREIPRVSGRGGRDDPRERFRKAKKDRR